MLPPAHMGIDSTDPLYQWRRFLPMEGNVPLVLASCIGWLLPLEKSASTSGKVLVEFCHGCLLFPAHCCQIDFEGGAGDLDKQAQSLSFSLLPLCVIRAVSVLGYRN